MSHRTRDLARRFITFIDAVYEARGKLVLTTQKPLTQLFMTKDELGETIEGAAAQGATHARTSQQVGHDVDDTMRLMMDDLGVNMDVFQKSNIFSGDEEAFAFARALSRLTEMGSKEWVERGLGMQEQHLLKETDR